MDSCGGNAGKSLSAVVLRSRALASWQIVTDESPSFVWACDAEASRENGSEPVCFSHAPASSSPGCDSVVTTPPAIGRRSHCEEPDCREPLLLEQSPSDALDELVSHPLHDWT